MEFPDLHEFPKDHPASPYGEPVLVRKVGHGILPEGLSLRAVGWLNTTLYRRAAGNHRPVLDSSSDAQ
jgi:hypothetical protein